MWKTTKDRLSVDQGPMLHALAPSVFRVVMRRPRKCTGFRIELHQKAIAHLLVVVLKAHAELVECDFLGRRATPESSKTR